MDKLLKAKKRQHIIAVTSLIVGALAIFGIIFFILMLLYVPMGICIALAAHGFYGCPFYFFINAKLKICISMLEYIEENGTSSLSEISAAIGVKEDYLKKLLDYCVEKEFVAAEKVSCLAEK